METQGYCTLRLGADGEDDLLRRRTKKGYPDGSSESYSYDAAERMLTAVNKEASYGYSYDSAGWLARVADSRVRTREGSGTGRPGCITTGQDIMMRWRGGLSVRILSA
jgi:YD repeat-containing protein